MKIIPYDPFYSDQIITCFVESIEAIPDTFYDQAQRKAWSASAQDKLFWQQRLATKQPFLAIIDAHVVGFIELDPNGHIDCLYVHPAYQRRQVATKLYQFIEAIAINKGMIRLFVEASYLAAPFFESQGFKGLERLEQVRHGQILVNFIMEKQLIKRGHNI